MITCPEGTTGTVRLPGTVRHIGYCGFQNTMLDGIQLSGGDRIVCDTLAFFGCDPNLVLKSGLAGSDPEAYLDEAMT